MNLDRTPSTIASAAAEEIRILNHATLEPKSLPYAGEVSRTVISLRGLIEGLPQTLDQLAHGLRAVEEQGNIRMDDGSDVAVEVETAVDALETAKEAVESVRRALAAASTPLFHMGAPYTPDDDDDEDDD